MCRRFSRQIAQEIRRVRPVETSAQPERRKKVSLGCGRRFLEVPFSKLYYRKSDYSRRISAGQAPGAQAGTRSTRCGLVLDAAWSPRTKHFAGATGSLLWKNFPAFLPAAAWPPPAAPFVLFPALCTHALPPFCTYLL